MKKILHIFRSSKFSGGFVKTINKYYGNKYHVFWIYGQDFLLQESEYLYENNVKYIFNFAAELKKPDIDRYMDTFDQIIYHGIFDYNVMKFFADNQELLKKLYLYFWGGDIPLTGSEEKRKIKCEVVQKAAGIVVIIESDYKRIVDLYHPRGQKFCAQYCDEEQVKIMHKYLSPRNQEEGEELFIQIGNSATDTNNHFEILDILQRYKNEKIRIFLPLAYGDMNYAKKVIAYGKELFGDKIVALTEMMQLDAYIKYLSKMNIGIFGMDRQQALGNIQILFLNGCKIYLNQGGQLDSYFSDHLKCKIFYIEDINQMCFQDFKLIAYQERIQNMERIAKILDTDYKMIRWNELFGLVQENNGENL